MSPLSSVLAQRLGVRKVVPAGLALMAGGLWWLSNITPTTGYPHLAVAVVMMGAGMGLIMAPASESIMGALPQEQAGAGSAVNDTVREVGGALGVAVVGSVVSAAYRAQLHLPGLPATAVSTARSSIAAADQVAASVGPHAAAVTAAAHRAFASGMTDGLQVVVILTVAGMAAAAWALPSRRRAAAPRVAEPHTQAVGLDETGDLTEKPAPELCAA